MDKKANALHEFLEEQMNALPEIRFRRMFGGYGIYAGDRFFGIIHGDRLFFHTNDTSQVRYEKAGMGRFVTPGRRKELKRYSEVPLDVIESRRELVRWAKESIATAG